MHASQSDAPSFHSKAIPCLPGPIRLETTALTHTGLSRATNQDSVGAFVTTDATRALLIVADGMGGHAGGDKASRMVVERLANAFSAGMLENPDQLQETLLQLDADIHDEVPDGGTTVVVALATTTAIDLMHIGDSRAYLMHETILTQMTIDHSLVQAQVESGALTQAEARLSPRRNVLLKALGTGRQEMPDLRHTKFEAGDRLILCSDGLHGVLNDGQIGHIALTEFDISDTANALLRETLRAGAPDNVSVVVCTVSQATSAVELQACSVGSDPHWFRAGSWSPRVSRP